MKKILIALISIILAVFMIAGCTPTGEDDETTTANGGGTTAPGGEENKEIPKELLEKAVFSSEHFTINGKMTVYLYDYLLSVYYQYYGSYAPYYVTADTVKSEASELLAFCEAAYAAGEAELDEDDLKEISDAVAEMEEAFKQSGYDTLEAYYGKGVGSETVFEAMKLQYIAVNYSNVKTKEIYDSLAADKDALLTYYNEHKTLLFGTCYTVTIDDETYFTRLSAATTREEMKAIAAEYATAKEVSVDSIAAEKAINYPELKEGEELTATQKWLFDGSRKYGDVYADAESKTVYFVILPAVIRNELLRSAGHILIIPESETEEAKAAAKAKAESLLASYLAGDKTKESFEAIAKENTKDGNVFYDDIYIGQMVEPFNDWVYDTARQTGDTGIVETEYGYHVMYYVGEGELKNYEYFAVSEMYDTKISEFGKSVREACTVTVDSDALKELIES